MEERLQKVLANSGIGSRRACDTLIVDGRVRVNGNIAVPGMKVNPLKDTILLDGKNIHEPKKYIYVMLNKPRNVISSANAQGSREIVRDLIPLSGNLFIVGRLDADSEGLILLTNDGSLANKLTHPRFGHEKEYRVYIENFPDEGQLTALRQGMVLGDGFHTQPAHVRLIRKAGKGAWISVVLHEGHKRQIREMGKIVGLRVIRIIRIRISSLHLGDLKSGEWRQLTKQEVEALLYKK